MGSVALVLFAAVSAAAQPRQITARGDMLMCESSGCTAAGAPCPYGVGEGTCDAPVGDALLCIGAGHTTEPQCCTTDSECPSTSQCWHVDGEDFGVCLGPDSPPLTFCADPSALTSLDLVRCRDGTYASTYDWGHGDCDGDGMPNTDDPMPCEGTPICACDADVVKDPSSPYQVNLTDVGAFSVCLRDPTSPDCMGTDVNCDGEIDLCDAAIVAQVMARGYTQPEPFLCAQIECGGCETSDGCVRTSQDYCTRSLMGTYRPRCRAPADGGTDASVADSGAADTRRGSDAEPATFRGAGGCACRLGARDQNPAGPALFLVLLLVALRLRKTA